MREPRTPWGRHYDEADKADELAGLEVANGNEVRAEFWRRIADQKRVDGERAMVRQLPKGWQR